MDMKSDISILVIDDNSRFLRAAARAITQAGFERIELATDADQAMDFVTKSNPDLTLLDVYLEAEDYDGLDLLVDLLDIVVQLPQARIESRQCLPSAQHVI